MLIGLHQRSRGKCLHLMLNGDVLRQTSILVFVQINTLLGMLILIMCLKGKLYCIIRLRPVSCKVLHLLYCYVVWSPCSANYTRHLERIHSRFTLSISSSTSAVHDLKLSLTERQTYHTAVKVFKILHKLVPAYLHGFSMPQQFLVVLGEILYDCLFQVLEQIMEEALHGFVVLLYVSYCDCCSIFD